MGGGIFLLGEEVVEPGGGGAVVGRKGWVKRLLLLAFPWIKYLIR